MLVWSDSVLSCCRVFGFLYTLQTHLIQFLILVPVSVLFLNGKRGRLTCNNLLVLGQVSTMIVSGSIHPKPLLAISENDSFSCAFSSLDVDKLQNSKTHSDTADSAWGGTFGGRLDTC